MAMAMFHPPAGAPRRRSSALSPSSFCVVSYNILSSHLAQPDHFRTCKPADLEQHTRLQRVKQKLKPELQKGSIICLQEVWAIDKKERKKDIRFFLLLFLCVCLIEWIMTLHFYWIPVCTIRSVQNGQGLSMCFCKSTVTILLRGCMGNHLMGIWE